MDTFESIGLQLRNLNHLIRRTMDASPVSRRLFNMTGTNVWLIAYIGERTRAGDSVCQRDIEETFGITRSCVSRVVQLMEQKGLLVRLPVAEDARRKQLVLTEEASCMTGELKRNAEAMEARLTAGFTPQERAQLTGYLTRMQNNLESSLRDSEAFYSKEETEKE